MRFVLNNSLYFLAWFFFFFSCYEAEINWPGAFQYPFSFLRQNWESAEVYTPVSFLLGLKVFAMARWYAPNHTVALKNTNNSLSPIRPNRFSFFGENVGQQPKWEECISFKSVSWSSRLGRLLGSLLHLSIISSKWNALLLLICIYNWEMKHDCHLHSELGCP